MAEEVVNSCRIYDEVRSQKTDEFQVVDNECYLKHDFIAVRDIKDRRVPPMKVKCEHSTGKLLYGVFILFFVVAIVLFAVMIGAIVEFYTVKLELTSLQRRLSAVSYASQNNTDINMWCNCNDKKNCLLSEQLQNSTSYLMSTIQNISTGQLLFLPATSCAAVLQQTPTSPSGYYWILSSSGYAVRVYCDMTRSCGIITGGWMRVAQLDIRDQTAQCPNNLVLNETIVRSCRINSTNGFSSVKYSVHAIDFSRVCGKVTAYQIGAPDAYNRTSHYKMTFDINNIDNIYVDGISITHGFPREHIWTFAAALNELGSTPGSICPCINTTLSQRATGPPSFVKNDYFCDTGSRDTTFNVSKYYTNYSLWDGEDCGPDNTCCSFNNPPWFYKQLLHPTTDDIEMRVFRDQGNNDEDIALETVEIYVH